jgi:ketosteroid isomerase-like protein
MPSDVADIIRRSYACYPARDRATHESLIAADFHFTSPYDDRIDRTRYFERCWPNSEHIRSLTIEKLFVDGDEAFVRYRLQLNQGPAFRNTEFIRTGGGQIREVEVYFGELPRST